MINDRPSDLSTSSKRIERIEKIRRLLWWPMACWMALMLASVILRASQLDQFRYVEIARRSLEVAVFYSFPIILLYVVGATFYSSYKILESRGYKNLATFVLVQCLAYFLIDVIGVSVPKLGTATSIALTGAFALTLFLAMYLVQRSINPLNMEQSNPGIATSPRLGAVISGFASLIIASIIYFRVRDGISFVTWGVFFGVLLSIVVFSSDKMVLGLLFFLDPGGAINLFNILRVKRELEDQRDLKDVRNELANLDQEKMKIKMIELADELKREHWKAEYGEAKSGVEAMINQLREANSLPPDHRRRILAEVTSAIEHIRNTQTVPTLPAPDYDQLSLGEKVSQLVGLTNDEIAEAVEEGLVSRAQSHIWLHSAQAKLRQALLDFKEENFDGEPPIFVAKAWSQFVQANHHIAQAMIDRLVVAARSEFLPIKGAENWEIFEFRFTTVTRTYSAVIKQGPDPLLVVVGIFEAFSKDVLNEDSSPEIL